MWFGVLLAVNMQTSFMHPPFGFALFYLRSVAAHDDYTDKVTGKRIKKVTIEQIYWGAVPFVIIQVLMVALIIAFPALVSSGLAKETKLDADKLLQQMESQPRGQTIDINAATAGSAAASEAAGEKADDPMKGLLDSMKREQDASADTGLHVRRTSRALAAAAQGQGPSHLPRLRSDRQHLVATKDPAEAGFGLPRQVVRVRASVAA